MDGHSSLWNADADCRTRCVLLVYNGPKGQRVGEAKRQRETDKCTGAIVVMRRRVKHASKSLSKLHQRTRRVFLSFFLDFPYTHGCAVLCCAALHCCTTHLELGD